MLPMKRMIFCCSRYASLVYQFPLFTNIYTRRPIRHYRMPHFVWNWHSSQLLVLRNVYCTLYAYCVANWWQWYSYHTLITLPLINQSSKPKKTIKMTATTHTCTSTHLHLCVCICFCWWNFAPLTVFSGFSGFTFTFKLRNMRNTCKHECCATYCYQQLKIFHLSQLRISKEIFSLI